MIDSRVDSIVIEISCDELMRYATKPVGLKFICSPLASDLSAIVQAQTHGENILFAGENYFISLTIL